MARIYQRKLLFWIGMYLSIAFGSALQGFTQHQPIYVWTANVVFSLLIVFLWHKFSGYIQEVKRSQLTGQAYPGLFVCAVQCHVSSQCLAVVGIFVAAAGHYGFDRKWY